MCEPENELSADFSSKILSVLWRYRFALAFFIIGIIFFLGFLFNHPDFPGRRSSLIIEEPATAQPEQNLIKIDIEGAVKNPGVYELKSGSRTVDALKAAGGFAQNADNSWVSKNLNLAQKLFDGAKIYLPFQNETFSISNPINLGNLSNLINLNSASQSDLELLPGVGPATAQKIISGRPFEKPEDLLEKKIVGKSLFEKIKDKISAY